MFDETSTWVLTGLCIAALLGILWWRLSPIILFRKRAINVQGQITNWMSARHKGKLIFKPVIQFHTTEGDAITIASEDRCEGEPKYPVGTTVEVLYDPKNPEFTLVRYPEK